MALGISPLVLNVMMGPLLTPPPGPPFNEPLESRMTAPPMGATADELPNEPGTPTVLFVNFEGAVLRGNCGNDARRDCSTLGYLFDDYVGPFTGGAAFEAAILDAVRADLANLGVAVTARRPADDVDYTMVLYGDLGDQTFAGVAPYIDCADQKRNDTSFSRGFASPNTGSTVILQEAAHTWGLEHVNSREDILHPIAEGLAPTFRDECAKIVSNTDLDETPGICNRMHELYCEPGFQNSFQELAFLFGPAQPDTQAPRIELLSPLPGAVHELPAVPEIRVRIEDDRHPQFYQVDIELDGVNIFSDELWGDYELAFVVPAAGDYPLRMTVRDEAGNQDEVEFSFEMVEPGTLDPATGAGGCSLGANPDPLDGGAPWPAGWLLVAGTLPWLRRRRATR